MSTAMPFPSNSFPLDRKEAIDDSLTSRPEFGSWNLLVAPLPPLLAWPISATWGSSPKALRKPSVALK